LKGTEITTVRKGSVVEEQSEQELQPEQED